MLGPIQTRNLTYWLSSNQPLAADPPTSAVVSGSACLCPSLVFMCFPLCPGVRLSLWPLGPTSIRCLCPDSAPTDGAFPVITTSVATASIICHFLAAALRGSHGPVPRIYVWPVHLNFTLAHLIS